MLGKIFLLFFILGVNEVVVNGNEDIVFRSQLKRPECHLLCGLCKCVGRVTKIFLEYEPFIPIMSRIFAPLCEVLPQEHWRNECLIITHELPKRVRELAHHMNVTGKCTKLGFCGGRHPMLLDSEVSSCKFKKKL
ncbi:unnamed protein product [Schistosoma turkestanicum]|nr:unnamed protein product [Schistosoma turkestanicum]